MRDVDSGVKRIGACLVQEPADELIVLRHTVGYGNLLALVRTEAPRSDAKTLATDFLYILRDVTVENHTVLLEDPPGIDRDAARLHRHLREVGNMLAGRIGIPTAKDVVIV